MTKMIQFAGALLMTVAVAAPAFADMTRVVTGPRGNSTTATAQTNCTGGACTRSVEHAGPNGNSVDSEAVLVCENGYCYYTHVTEGENYTTQGFNVTVSR